MTDIAIADELQISDDNLQLAYQDIFGINGIMENAFNYYYPKLKLEYPNKIPDRHPYLLIIHKWWVVHDDVYEKLKKIDQAAVQKMLNAGYAKLTIIKKIGITKGVLKSAINYGLVSDKLWAQKKATPKKQPMIN